MFHVVLVEPEIPPNTGNVIRLCANAGAQLHLIHPLGFVMDDSRLRRAGLDYREWARVREHPSIEDFLCAVRPQRVLAYSSKAARGYHRVRYQPGDCLAFGPETRGLNVEMLERLAPVDVLRIPMVPASRSLNLSNAVGVVLYEAWRQHDFSGGG
jgi:tRNA (cytidine/uridine-2'-O-)-methyltransferase